MCSAIHALKRARGSRAVRVAHDLTLGDSEGVGDARAVEQRPRAKVERISGRIVVLRVVSCGSQRDGRRIGQVAALHCLVQRAICGTDRPFVRILTLARERTCVKEAPARRTHSTFGNERGWPGEHTISLNESTPTVQQ